MANRIRDNVYILDGTGSLSWPASAKVQTISFYGANSTAQLVLTLAADTTDAIFGFSTNGSNNQAWYGMIPLGGVWFPSQLNVLTITAGTGFIYFS